MLNISTYIIAFTKIQHTTPQVVIYYWSKETLVASLVTKQYSGIFTQTPHLPIHTLTNTI